MRGLSATITLRDVDAFYPKKKRKKDVFKVYCLRWLCQSIIEAFQF